MKCIWSSLRGILQMYNFEAESGRDPWKPKGLGGVVRLRAVTKWVLRRPIPVESGAFAPNLHLCTPARSLCRLSFSPASFQTEH